MKTIEPGAARISARSILLSIEISTELLINNIEIIVINWNISRNVVENRRNKCGKSIRPVNHSEFLFSNYVLSIYLFYGLLITYSLRSDTETLMAVYWGVIARIKC